ncbi:hypothetical protein CAPTEDRAFT_190796 [Capitella teleta]|uniref:TNFR-Cys domain-containing protein n=1 Tax=Capitella teleta TaxID=283909 RepID=R7TV96_CAPTE|nr:hypothetical protein CAPTEDRAFT_190796 [Capitella teleta]|eukprot:ELT95381.1 hypothetical protein CAPTEDRAFT_190796 [Capitella teleta]
MLKFRSIAAVHVLLLLEFLRPVGAFESCGKWTCEKTQFCEPTAEVCLPCSDLCDRDLDWDSLQECEVLCPEWMKLTRNAAMTTNTKSASAHVIESEWRQTQIIILSGICVIIISSCFAGIVGCTMYQHRCKENRGVEEIIQQRPPSPESTLFNADADSVVGSNGHLLPICTKVADNTANDDGFESLDDVYIPITSEMIWPQAEAFFRNFKVRTEYNFTGTKVAIGGRHKDEQETHESISKNIICSPTIVKNEPTDHDLSQMPFSGTKSISDEENEKPQITAEQEECIRYLESDSRVLAIEKMGSKLMIRVERGRGLSEIEVKQRLIQAGVREEVFDIVMTSISANFQYI